MFELFIGRDDVVAPIDQTIFFYQNEDLAKVQAEADRLPSILHVMTHMEIHMPDGSTLSRWERETDKWTSPEADARLRALATFGLSKELGF